MYLEHIDRLGPRRHRDVLTPTLTLMALFERRRRIPRQIIPGMHIVATGVQLMLSITAAELILIRLVVALASNAIF